MPWFKVDDGWWSHPKTLLLSDSAQALWVRAGSYSMKHLTDGGVPVAALPMLRARPKAAQELVSAGLWTRVGDGYQFHDWAIYQPSRGQVEADRAAAAERQRKARESRRDKAVTHGVSSPSPTQPNPTQPIKEAENTGGGGTRGPFCSRHPGGTSDPCGPCRTARLSFEDAAKRETAKPTPTPARFVRPEDCDHPARLVLDGYCSKCLRTVTRPH